MCWGTDSRLQPTPSLSQQGKAWGRGGAPTIPEMEIGVPWLMKSMVEQVARHPQPQGEAEDVERLTRGPVFRDSPVSWQDQRGHALQMSCGGGQAGTAH